METMRTVVLGALGIASCLALLFVAAQLGVRWHRAVISTVALQGLLYQGALWGGVTFTLKRFDVGGSYFWLYAALLLSVAGMVWALYLLGATFFSRRFTD
jgi:hypothetical protein